LENYSWENSTRGKLKSVLDVYKFQGYKDFGLFGFSFGGNNVAKASEEFWKDLRVAAQFTPAPSSDDSNLIKVPTLLVDPGFASVNKVCVDHMRKNK